MGTSPLAAGQWSHNAFKEPAHGQLGQELPSLIGIWQHVAAGSCKGLSQSLAEGSCRGLLITIPHPETVPRSYRKRKNKWLKGSWNCCTKEQGKILHLAKSGHHRIIRTSHSFWTEDRKMFLVRKMMQQKYVKFHYISKFGFKYAVSIFPIMFDALKIFWIPYLDIFTCFIKKSIDLNASLN